MNAYSSTADALVERIRALMPAHPEIASMEAPWDLHKVPGFKCDDLEPSLFQASWALRRAQALGAAAPTEKPGG